MPEYTESVRRTRDFYAHTPNAPIYRTDFGYYSLGRWKREGYISDNTNLSELFGFDGGGVCSLGQLGWCEAQLLPCFKEETLEIRGEHELVRDYAGRSVLYFKGRRDGFMPTYVEHPVKDLASWERDIKWRLNPDSPERYADIDRRMKYASDRAAEGWIIQQNLIGGYMYLRSLIGPEDLLYKFYDEPELIRACMEGWLALSDRVTAEHQKYLDFDEVFMAEDICYKDGCLISPEFMDEFLFPYYQQLMSNIRARQRDKAKPLHIQIDTDGNCLHVIDLYKERLGMDYMSPFEVAAGCDVVEVRKKYPELLIRGGIDKRVLATTPDEIDRMLDRVMPFMRERGGFIPTCDHGVPEEVSFENYMHYRKRINEYCG